MHKYIFLLSTLTITSLHSMNNHQRYQHVPLIHNSGFSKDSTLSPNVKEKKCTCCQKPNREYLESENKLKKCLKNNIRNVILASSGIPSQCIEEAREFILDAGRERMTDILADFKAAKDL